MQLLDWAADPNRVPTPRCQFLLFWAVLNISHFVEIFNRRLFFHPVLASYKCVLEACGKPERIHIRPYFLDEVVLGVHTRFAPCSAHSQSSPWHTSGVVIKCLSWSLLLKYHGGVCFSALLAHSTILFTKWLSGRLGGAFRNNTSKGVARLP